MNWIETHRNLGILKENSNYEFEYKSTKDLQIKEIKPGCGNCTTSRGYKNGILTITYKSNTIPYHLGKTEQPINKTITIIYQDGTTETLSFSGIIKK